MGSRESVLGDLPRLQASYVRACVPLGAGTKELQACLHSKAPGATGNLVNVVLFHLLSFTSSISDVKKSQARSLLQ